jgi:glycine/D-amino acid oxidase-like deaminating enzyme
MTVSLWQSNQPPVYETDLLIVGAGLAGTSAAVHAKQEGLRVTITEKADLALGASGRNAGFMITGLDTYAHQAIAKYGEKQTWDLWHLSAQTIEFWWDIISKSNGTVQADKRGSLLLAESEAEAQELYLAAQTLQHMGLPAIWHADAPLKRGYFAAIEQPNDGAVDPVQLCHALLHQSGAELIPNNELYHLEQSDDCVTVYTRLHTFKARYVLLCTNAYSALLHPYFEGKVIPTRAQVLVTEPLPASVIPSCGYSDYGYMYYRMTFDGRFLLGGARHHYRELEHNTTEDKLNLLVQAKLDEYMRQWFPDVTAPIVRRWAGIMGFSVDGLPMVGTLPKHSRVGFAVGFTGHGLATSAMTTRRALRKLLHGEHAGAVDVERLGIRA